MSHQTCSIHRVLFFGFLVSFASMLLILTLVYLFHGFQSHAAPLTRLLVESGSVISTPACVCPVDQRTIWDILWGCLATIFACSWVSVHPNIPAPNKSSWRIFLRRLELMFWGIVGPEFIIAWAFRQWMTARCIGKLYKGVNYQTFNVCSNVKS